MFPQYRMDKCLAALRVANGDFQPAMEMLLTGEVPAVAPQQPQPQQQQPQQQMRQQQQQQQQQQPLPQPLQPLPHQMHQMRLGGAALQQQPAEGPHNPPAYQHVLPQGVAPEPLPDGWQEFFDERCAPRARAHAPMCATPRVVRVLAGQCRATLCFEVAVWLWCATQRVIQVPVRHLNILRDRTLRGNEGRGRWKRRM